MLLAAKRPVGNHPGMGRPPRRRPTAVQQKESFAQRLRNAREQKYDSAAAFARAIEVEEETYRRWERAETEPGIVDLNAIIDELDVSADYLVTGILPPPPKLQR